VLAGQLLIYINGLNSDEVGGLDPLAQGHQHAGGTYVVVTRDAGLAALVPEEGRGFGAKGEATTRPLLLPQEGVRFAPRPFVRHFLVKKSDHLPRQARDKLQNQLRTKWRCFCPTGLVADAQP